MLALRFGGLEMARSSSLGDALYYRACFGLSMTNVQVPQTASAFLRSGGGPILARGSGLVSPPKQHHD